MFCLFEYWTISLTSQCQQCTERFEPKTFLLCCFYANLKVYTLYPFSITDFNKLNLAWWVGFKLWLKKELNCYNTKTWKIKIAMSLSMLTLGNANSPHLRPFLLKSWWPISRAQSVHRVRSLLKRCSSCPLSWRFEIGPEKETFYQHD